MDFSRTRSKGSRFTLGGLGVEAVFNRPQPSATVRKCPCEGRMAVPVASSAKVITFGGFKRLVASFRLAGLALRDIQTCFVTCRSRFVWQAQYFCDVFRRCVPVLVAGAALWRPPSPFGMAGTAL